MARVIDIDYLLNRGITIKGLFNVDQVSDLELSALEAYKDHIIKVLEKEQQRTKLGFIQYQRILELLGYTEPTS